MSKTLPGHVGMEDLRAIQTGNTKPGYCARGIRLWCSRYGIPVRLLSTGGIPAELIERTGDAMGLRAVEQMKKREQNGR